MNIFFVDLYKKNMKLRNGKIIDKIIISEKIPAIFKAIDTGDFNFQLEYLNFDNMMQKCITKLTSNREMLCIIMNMTIIRLSPLLYNIIKDFLTLSRWLESISRCRNNVKYFAKIISLMRMCLHLSDNIDDVIKSQEFMTEYHACILRNITEVSDTGLNSID
jgi:hypothetical protein